MDANIKTPQDALEWLDRRIREEAEADGEMTNEHAIQLGFIQNMLVKFPRRNCDIGSLTDQRKRFSEMCKYNCDRCALQDDRALKGGCEFSWAQMPYNESEAGK